MQELEGSNLLFGDLASQIVELILAVPGVQQVHEIYAHRFGSYLVVNIAIGIDGRLTVTKGDEIATEVENILLKHFELIRRVHVHFHPAVPARLHTEPALHIN